MEGNRYRKKGVIRGRTIAVGSVMQEVLHSFEGEASVAGEMIFNVWEEAVGSKISKHAQPQSFKGKVLHVSVDSSAWLFKLARFHGEEIKAAINQRLGAEAIEEIKFRLGSDRYTTT